MHRHHHGHAVDRHGLVVRGPGAAAAARDAGLRVDQAQPDRLQLSDQLPALHRQLYADDYPQVVTVGELLKAYHRHRVTRVLAKDYGAVRPRGVPGRADGFIGAVGVSFLTAV